MESQRTGGARPTKAERKEQARRERMELQRKMARARRNRRIALVAALLVAAGAAAFALTRPGVDLPEPDELLAAAAQARTAAGCGEIEDVGAYEPESEDRSHTAAPPPLSSYASQPPASGPHADSTMSAGVYSSPPSVGQVIHSLEHGAAIVWFSPDATGPELDELRAFFGQDDVGSRVIVAPYDYPDEGPAAALPEGTEMALVAWHTVQTCSRLSLPAAFAFTASYAAPPFEEPYLGSAPEPGAPI